MAIYYKAISDSMKDQSKFGDIMINTSQQLLKYGIELAQINADIDKILKDYYQGYQVLNEEFIPKKENKNTIKTILGKHIRGLNHDGKVLIIDPYLFPNSSENDHKYISFLTEIFKPHTDLSKLLILTNRHEYSEKLKMNFVNSMINNGIFKSVSDIQITIDYKNEIHDRIWLSAKEHGFLCGTSLNGLGKKYSLITEIDKSDSKEFLSLAREKGVNI
ncbi:hypothetical protein [Sutcliffiella cohnii]|uniref:hypothetical protein n=1 Tax=Sutcliffiella cohnii TaxID=33932 RepID=UPI002E22FB87|nr:hypothetical protein [Sutcliffiella cohnii]